MAAPGVMAQSLVDGGITGVVRDAAGRPVYEANVTLIDNATGIRRGLLTPRSGAVQFTLLPAADYDLLVERFGYAPRLVRRVPVRSGALAQVSVTINEGTPDAAVDTVTFGGVPSGGAQLALVGRGADVDFAELADLSTTITGVGDLFGGANGALGASGLPGRLGVIALDGVPRVSARHAREVDAALDGIAFPLGAVRGVQMPGPGSDAEWPGVGGGLLSAYSAPASHRVRAGALALAGPDAQHAMAVISGPIVRDTAQFVLGAAVTRVAPQRDAPWPADSAADTLAAAIAGIARDSFQTDLSAYRLPYKAATTRVSGFGRLDWNVTPDHRLSVRAEGASETADQPDFAATLPALGSKRTAHDVSAAATLASSLPRGLGNELRLSLDASSREYAGSGLARTLFVDGGFAAGGGVQAPGTFKRTTFRFAETLHYRVPIGLLKGGVQIGLNSFDQTYADDRAGTFYFGDSTGFATTTGAFRQTVGSLPAAKFKTTDIGIFAQALLRPAPSFEVTIGLRRDEEIRPIADIRANTAWATATGIDNTAVPKKRPVISPRVSLNWMLGAARRWQVTADAGQASEASDPGLLAEVITHATNTQIRRGVGALGSWPRVPDSTAAPVMGQALSLLTASYAPPRTRRAGLGLSGNVGGTLLRFQGTYRHTDFLPVRRDLNLSVNPRGRDSYGRVLYGPLVRQGAVLAAAPGGNRRFSAFDEVSVIDPSAASDYWGFSTGIERTVGHGLDLMTSYTYSRTTDNWFGARATSAEGQFVPLTDSAGRSPWSDGRSDFDTPHQVVLGAALHLGARARLSALYRWRSGLPFTPGFRDGVDANGDGSARNDPAFVVDTVPGAASVIATNSCLTAQVGRMAERNSCRDPARTSLDLRLAITLGRAGGLPAELLVDAIGVVQGGTDVMDHALYLLDPARTVTTNVTTGVTTVPLIANPNFGQVLAKRSTGAIFRAGLRVGF